MMKKHLHHLGIVLCVLGIGFVCMKLIPNMASVLNAFPQDINSWCLFCFLCFAYAGALNLLALGWRGQLQFNTKLELPLKDTLGIYGQSQIAKYIPGNVFQYIGRNVLASRYQLDGLIVLKSSLYEIASLLLSALFLIAGMMIFSPIPLFPHVFESISIPIWFGLIILVSLILGIYFKWTAKVKHFISDYFVPYFWFAFTFHVFSVLIFIGLWLGVMHQPFSLDTILILGSAYLMSWFIGFVTPGSPGGLGVREALFILLASTPAIESQILFMMVSSRLLNTLGDFLFFIQGYWNSRNEIETA